jgi:diguanylate cyclase (GGDEF)-like protein
MTDGGTRSVAGIVIGKVLTLNGVIATAGVLALVIGFFVQSLPGWLVCGGVAVCAAGYLLVFAGGGNSPAVRKRPEAQQPDPTMKTLLFDDFQGADGKFVVKEAEDQHPIVPSTREAEPVAIPDGTEAPRELTIPDFFELETDEPLAEVEPKSEFHGLMDKVLLVLKDVLFAHTVAFFWANRDKRQLVVEAMATDSKAFMGGRRYEFGHDLVTQVATTGKPQLVGRLTPETQQELLHYYEAPDPVRSVVAVPVFYKSGEAGILPVGVIVADSKAEDAFGQETLAMFGRFTKLVSALVKSYTDKYDLLLESELLSSIRRLQDRAKSDPSEEGILTSLCDELHRLVTWECLTITMYSDQAHGWAIQRVLNAKGGESVAAGKLVDVTASVIGEVIRSNRLEIVHDLSTRDGVRFYAGEPGGGTGTFLGVPISSLNRCYGALSLESPNASAFSGSEVEVVYRLVENTASLLEVLYMNDVIKKHVAVDRATGALTQRHFLRAVDEEVQRADDFGTDLALVTIALDKADEAAARYGRDGVEVITAELAHIAKNALRSYDVLGHQEEGKLGALLVQTAGTDGSLWGEKIRKAVAGHVITIAGRTFSVTVSVGVCGLVDGMRAEDLLSGAGQVLDAVSEAGGNAVRVF